MNNTNYVLATEKIVWFLEQQGGFKAWLSNMITNFDEFTTVEESEKAIKLKISLNKTDYSKEYEVWLPKSIAIAK